MSTTKDECAIGVDDRLKSKAISRPVGLDRNRIRTAHIAIFRAINSVITTSRRCASLPFNAADDDSASRRRIAADLCRTNHRFEVAINSCDERELSNQSRADRPARSVAAPLGADSDGAGRNRINTRRRTRPGKRETNADVLHECSRPARFTGVHQVTRIHHASRKYLTNPRRTTWPPSAAFGH